MGVTFTRSSLAPGDEAYGNSYTLQPFQRVPGLAAQGTSTSGRLWLTYFTANRGTPVTTAIVGTGGTAAGATPTLVRIGLWTAAADGSLTALVASTANDTTLLAGTNTAYPKALSATYNPIYGQRYAAGLLVVSGAAMPNIQGTTTVTGFLNANPRISAYVAGQTDLPATVAAGSLTDTGIAMFIGFY